MLSLAVIVGLALVINVPQDGKGCREEDRLADNWDGCVIFVFFLNILW
jgi:hypothetical protein